MVFVGKFITGIMTDISSLMEEVAEDLAICGTMESVMPSPPPLSHLYLKYCEARGKDEDAGTPRVDDTIESDIEEQPDGSLGPAVTGLSASMTQTQMTATQ